MQKVIQGDCLEVLRRATPNSIDAIITDPPYELGFMGKSWDSTGIANNVELWKECLRVLKPGGYLLSFGGTRTYHRMASAIEDAGFEVRDMIEWVYGCLSEDTEILTANGWKMLYSIFEGDYVFACDYINDMKLQLEPVKQKFIYDYDEDAYHIKDTGYYNSELMETDHIVSKNHNVLVSESWAMDCFSNGEYPQKVAAEVLYKNVQKRKELGYKSDFHIPGLNGFIPCTIEKIHYKGKVWCVEVESGAFVARRNGKIFITGNSGFPKSLNIGKAVDKLQGNEREIVGEYQHPDGKQRNWSEHISPKEAGSFDGGWDNNGRILDKGTSEWEGWGTALKPSHEPICMARKPLGEKTVAQNVLKYGTGGINIDESRVETSENITIHKGNKFGGIAGITPETFKTDGQSLGRFPANLLHDNSEEVRECFPETKTGKAIRSNSGGKTFGGENTKPVMEDLGYDDNGGNASRFFKSIIYQAKASKSERNKGCEELEEKVGIRTNAPRENEDIKTPTRTNNHPTVKPIALMEYLVKLVSREGALVLDPFAGSGSTLLACKNLGRGYVGIEMDEEYIKIINARLGNTL